LAGIGDARLIVDKRRRARAALNEEKCMTMENEGSWTL
jgi:hypothetical protein